VSAATEPKPKPFPLGKPPNPSDGREWSDLEYEPPKEISLVAGGVDKILGLSVSNNPDWSDGGGPSRGGGALKAIIFDNGGGGGAPAGCGAPKVIIFSGSGGRGLPVGGSDAPKAIIFVDSCGGGSAPAGRGARKAIKFNVGGGGGSGALKAFLFGGDGGALRVCNAQELNAREFGGGNGVSGDVGSLSAVFLLVCLEKLIVGGVLTLLARSAGRSGGGDCFVGGIDGGEDDGGGDLAPERRVRSVRK